MSAGSGTGSTSPSPRGEAGLGVALDFPDTDGCAHVSWGDIYELFRQLPRLRVVGNEVQTSFGARVSVKQAAERGCCCSDCTSAARHRKP